MQPVFALALEKQVRDAPNAAAVRWCCPGGRRWCRRLPTGSWVADWRNAWGFNTWSLPPLLQLMFEYPLVHNNLTRSSNQYHRTRFALRFIACTLIHQFLLFKDMPLSNIKGLGGKLRARLT